jgi:hypothetical protein
MRNIVKKATILILFSGYCLAGTVNIKNPAEISDATAYVMPTPLPPIFNQNMSMDRVYNDLNDFSNRLQILTSLKSIIVNTPLTKINPVKIYQVNGTLTSLLDQASLKFNAKWHFNPQSSQIIFTYISGSEVLGDNKSTAIKNNPTIWEINPQDKTLRVVLTKWCKKSNWQLIWNVKADYPITTAWGIPGTFESAVNEVLKASQSTDTPLQAVMHDSNRVLEIYTAATSK